MPGTTNFKVVESTLLTRDQVISLLKTNCEKGQRRMNLNVNKHRRDLSFSKGDWLYVKLQHYKQFSVADRQHHKLCKRYYGPYQIVEKLGPVATSYSYPLFHAFTQFLTSCQRIESPTSTLPR